MTFGVITFYKKQVGLIWKALKDEGLAELIDEDYQVIKSLKQTEKNGEFTEKLRIGTVDTFQGLEFDCVMLSVVRSNNIKLTESEETWKSKYGFLMLENRSCVAMSRQQRLLIVFGDKEMFKNEYAQQAVPALANLVEICK
jgi:superfamily I DNA and/or RNA helicase